MNLKKLIAELKRRNVFKVATAYAIAGWLIIQVISTIAPQLHLPQWVPTFFTILVLTGFPIAIILAWAFEMTPDGVKRTDEVPEEKSVTQKTGRRLNVVLGVLLVITVGIIFYQQFFRAQPAISGGVSKGTAAADSASALAKSIAVLPFENMSPDSNNVYFANGMQDMILTKLADIGDLKVISRTSTERYKSHPGDLKTIAAQLGVATILEGSVQKAGKQVLINVQLINAQSDNHIWAQSYTRTLDNIFGVEGEVAEKIASALNAKLSPAESKAVAHVPTHNPAAYDAYLRGLSIETNTTLLGTSQSADSAYRRAVQLDPNFALAWAHLSSINSFTYFNFIAYTPAHLAKAKQALDRAIALAPDAIATQIAAGDYYYHGLRHYDEALAAYRKVLKISPNNAAALVGIGYVERRLGHWQTAIDYMELSLAFDPRNVQTLEDLGDSYFCLLDFRKAKEMYRRVLAINPDAPLTIVSLSGVFLSEGDTAQAGNVLAGTKISSLKWTSYPYTILNVLLIQRHAEAIQLLKAALAQKKMVSKPSQGIYYEMLGYAEQLSGDHEAAHRAYSRAMEVLQQVSESPAVVYARAFAQAGLGQKTAALASARRLMALFPPSRDAFMGPVGELYLAVIQTEVGEKSRAIATLKHLLAMPPGNAASIVLNPSRMRIDPRWDPLRKDPAFQALIKE